MHASYSCRAASTLEEIQPHLPAWSGLMSRALEDNLYLSPGFVMPTLRHLMPPGSYIVIFVYRHDEHGARLAAVAPFSICSPTWRRPLRVLSGLTGPHSYLSHPLVARDDHGGALEALWQWLERPEHPWHLVHFQGIDATSPFLPMIRDSLEGRKRRYLSERKFLRPMLGRHHSFAAYLDALPPARRKHYKRRWRQLENAGKVEVILHRRLDEARDLAERFMQLEQLNWKGQAGTALGSAPSNAAFFREMMDNCGHDEQIFFVDLRLNGRSIAMTSNFICGRTMFAFKIAYDPAFRDFSPGILAEVQTVRLFLETPNLMCGEGGSSGPSYLSSYWRDLREMQAAYIAMPKWQARPYLALVSAVWRIKGAWRRLAGHSAQCFCVALNPAVNEAVQACCELI